MRCYELLAPARESAVKFGKTLQRCAKNDLAPLVGMRSIIIMLKMNEIQ